MGTIDALVAGNSKRFSGKTALRHKSAEGWQEISYDSLRQQFESVAAALFRWGVKPGDRIALLGSSSPWWIASYLGVLRTGGIAVPIDKELKSAELRHILFDCEARLLFTELPFLEALAEVAEELPLLEKIVLLQANGRPGGFSLSRTVEALNAEWRRLAASHSLAAEETARLEGLAEELRRLAAERDRASDDIPPGPFAREESLRRRALDRLAPEGLSLFAGGELPPPPPAPRRAEDTAVILYTSGTTGRAKGAMLSHANILSNIEAAVARFRVDSSIHTLSFLPINHVYEQVCGILLPLSIGGTISFAESIKKLGPNLAEVRPNFLLGVPAVFRLLFDRIRKSIDERPVSRGLFAFPPTRSIVRARLGKSLGNVTFISGGAPLDPEVSRGLRELGISIYQGYGITETSPVISFECPGETRPGSVGRPICGVAVRIEDPDQEGVGEVLVSGPNIMQGYFNNPQASAEVLEGGWYRTGDLGRFDSDGFLYLCGRKKNLIVTPNGKNVYPEEVEIELLKSPFIAEAMVYGHRIGPAEEVHALIYPDQEAIDALAVREGTSPLDQGTLEEIIRREVLEAGRRLADYKRVKKFTLREDEFPKTTTRKIKRFAVEAEILAERR